MRTIATMLIVVLAVFVLFIDDKPSKNRASEQVDNDWISDFERDNNPKSTYASRGVDNTWPKMATNQRALASNLLAKNYYVVLDGSGSMGYETCTRGGSRLSASKNAISEFVNAVSLDSGLGLFAFDSQRIGELVPIGQNQHQKVIKALNGVRAGGGTPLKTAVIKGVRALTEQAKKQLGYGEYHLVIVTDGEANYGEEPSSAVRQLVNGTPITLHTIGFCIDGTHSLNQPNVAIYRKADDIEALRRGLNDVLAEAPDFDATQFDTIGG